MAITAASHLDDLLTSFAHDPRLVHLEHLPARAARYAELATPLAPDLRERMPVDRFWTHQAAAIDLAPSRPVGRGGHRHRLGQVAVLPGADRRGGRQPRAPGHLAADLPHQGPGPGPAALAHRPRRARPGRRHLRRRLRSRGAHLGAGQRQRGAHQPRDAAPRHPPPPRAVGHVPHAPPLRRHRRAAHAARRLRHATSPTCCVGSAGCAPTTAPIPTFIFSSATIGAPGRLASELCGLDVVEVTDDGSPRGERHFALWNPRALLDPGPDLQVVPDAAALPTRRLRAPSTSPRPSRRSIWPRSSRPAPSANRETAMLVAELIRRGHRTIAFCRSRKGTELIAADVRRRLPADLADRCGPTGAATSPPSGARSRASCSAARSAASSPPPPSSSASTSAVSTPACSTGSPAPSRRCGSRRAGPGARPRSRSSCWWPATTSSTSGSWPTPTRSSPARPSRP